MNRIPNHCRLLLLLLLLPLTGCLLRSHRVERPTLSDAALQTATAQELVDRVNNVARNIRTLNATVDIATSVGGARQGKVTEYQEIRGYILVRQPGMLRMIGLMPVVRTRAFDMVSDGVGFKLFIQPKNKFYFGRNDVITPGTTGLTALRPQVIYNALLLNQINAADDIAVLESGTESVRDPRTKKDVEQPDYRLDVIHRGPNGWAMERKVYFSRIDLHPRRQTFFDAYGNIVSDIRYDKWKQYDGVWFPEVIQLWRPIEEYSITIGMLKVTMNQDLTDQQFALTQPPGAEVVKLNGAPINASDGTRK